MTAYVALLRGVNVGGRKLMMSDLKSIAEELGLDSPKTFIASGNLLFRSGRGEAALAKTLEERIGSHLGAVIPVMIRTADEMVAIASSNPFPNHPPNKVYAILLGAPPAPDSIESARNLSDERMALGRREIYVAYPSGMGQSKLRIPAAAKGTARNMNTITKLAELAKEME